METQRLKVPPKEKKLSFEDIEIQTDVDKDLIELSDLRTRVDEYKWKMLEIQLDIEELKDIVLAKDHVIQDQNTKIA